jgi:thiol-disulfide isomerase/thioredoxin
MNKIMLVPVLVAAAAAGFLLQERQARDATPGTAAPERTVAFTLPDLEGEPRSIDEWRGKVRLVNFWATWCAPCRREIPLLKQAQAEHGADNLQVIGVAVDNAEDVIAYAENADFNYPILVGQDDAMAAAEASGVAFIGLPFTLVVAPGGELIKAHIGEIVAEQIEQIVDVVQRLQEGELDLAAAREELATI